MSDPRRQIGDAVLEALRHTVGRDQHMPVFLELQHQVGPITYAEIAPRPRGREPEGRSGMAGGMGRADRGALAGRSIPDPQIADA
jgi:hypothetical protein